MTIAPEGRWIVSGVVALAVACFWIWGWASWPLWLPSIVIIQFFREPARHINADNDAILSPADGHVVFVGKEKSPIDGSPAVKISVFMSVFNVHSNRSPVAGIILQSERFAGSFFNAALDKASHNNERHLIEINSPHGRVVCVQVAGLLARRVLCYLKTGDTVKAGQRYGFIRFGSRADLYLPPHCVPLVALGDSVKAGITCMATVA
ncbi:phosphatidylserine decarboxylase [Candidatus Persebacteraceae bacterium Df01]|jgi:phosphatidylserine decarboxylase|uniref:Phosphatidylserine decarboxylase proenzyme n=1 Tax=Candidatus Doriopsillibacter californiensis TaxID=2970740 RepID=A0ABT7QJL7_9GAMM|nr:phosphatidylserine decarboxylase [Candidatus Persebacteraceae bacterium Df01]